jgi:hypothetical protein
MTVFYPSTMSNASIYPANASINDKILYVLSLLKKATADEVAMEIMELQATSSEEGVAELTIATSEALKQMQHQGLLKMETENDKQTRYSLKHLG